MRTTNPVVEAISRKLDIIIGLLIKVVHPEDATEQSQVMRLTTAGLGPEEVARALGKTPNAVYLMLSRSRRKGR